MDISLPPELEELVKQKLESGRYLSISDVIVDALWLLDARDRFVEVQREELRKEIQKGLDSGPSIPGEDFFSRMREKARKRLEEEK